MTPRLPGPGRRPRKPKAGHDPARPSHARHRKLSKKREKAHRLHTLLTVCAEVLTVFYCVDHFILREMVSSHSSMV